MYLSKRIVKPELMDDPDVDAAELGSALMALARTNRRLGGVRAVLREMNRWTNGWPPEQPLRVLDVATGSADIPVALASWASDRGLKIDITAIDLHRKTLDFARKRVETIPEVTVVQADALKLMDQFEPNSFDIVHAGLFLHHLHDLDVLTELRIMQRLASRGMIWNDLVRSGFTKVAIVPFSWLGPKIFRHDSIASMHAGFSRSEAMDFARRVGLENIRYRQILKHRFVLTSEPN